MNSQDRLMRGAAAAAVALFVGAGVALAAPGAISPSHSTGGPAVVVAASTTEPSEIAEPTETAEPIETAEPTQGGDGQSGDQGNNQNGNGDHGTSHDGNGQNGSQGGNDGQGND